VLVWIEACERCTKRRRERQAELDKLEELWRARTCAASDCSVAFEPAKAGQLYCSDRCRKRMMRRRKQALAASSNGAAPVGESSRGDSGHLR
jgi:hypothetical protein